MPVKYTLPTIEKPKTKSSLEPYFSLVRGKVIPGAHRLQRLLMDWLADGILQIPSLLITGSNGKGTTCAFLESILRSHGYKTGLYTSPHLIHPAERIRISGVPISEEILSENLDIITAAAKKNLPDASFFELSTATALLIFLKNKIDFLICEVGLGGHFDSTNAISPLVSILTSVSLEHTEYLGNSLEKIAADKSHISRRNRPFIVAKIDNKALLGVKKTVDKIGSNLIYAEDRLPDELENFYASIIHQTRKFTHLPENIFVKINTENLRTALSAFYYFHIEYLRHTNKKLEINFDLLTKGILSTKWPGRFDIRKINGRDVIFDASHNPDGFAYFLSQYQKSPYKEKKFTLLFASLSDKEWKKTFNLLPQLVKGIILTQIESDRAESVTKFVEFLENTCLPVSFKAIPKLDEALEYAVNDAPEYPLVITGSIAFIGATLQRFDLSFIEK